MSSMRASIQEKFYVATAIAVGLIALLDMLGWLEALPFLADHAAHFGLLLTALVLGYLIAERRDKLDIIEAIVRSTQALVEEETIDRISMLRHQIDPNLNRVFGEHISTLIKGIQTAARDKQVILHDVNTFRFFYQVTLEEYPRKEFLATSLPFKSFFWDDPKFMQDMAAFISNGGTIKRIFYVKMPRQLQSKETRQVLLAQHQAGVEVYVTDANELTQDMKRLFVVESDKSIAWEVLLDAEQQIGTVMATSDTAQMDELIRHWDRLLRLRTTERYIPSAISIGTSDDLHQRT